MPDRDPRDLAAWRALCEHIEDWLAKSGPPSRRRRSIHADEAAEDHRWLLATPLRTRQGRKVGNLCGLTQRQALEVQRVRGEYRLVVYGSSPGEGWSLRRWRGTGWRERLAELEAASGD